MVKENIQLSLELDSSRVSVGQSLTGIIHLKLLNEQLSDPLSIQFELVGEECIYQYSYNHSDSVDASPVCGLPFWSHPVHLDDNGDDFLSSLPKKLSIGIHCHLPFALPATPLPPRPSLDCYYKNKRSCHARFYLKASVNHDLTSTTRQPLTILPTPTGKIKLPDRPQVPLEHISSYELGAPSSGACRVALGVKLANTYVCPGETLCVGVAVQNRSTAKRIKRVGLQLYQDVRWHAPNRMHSQMEEEEEQVDNKSSSYSDEHIASAKPSRVTIKLWECKAISMPGHWLAKEKSGAGSVNDDPETLSSSSLNESIIDNVKKRCEENLISIPIPPLKAIGSGTEVLPTYSYNDSMISCKHRLEVTLVGEGLLYGAATTSWPLYFNIGGPYSDLAPRKRRQPRRTSMPNSSISTSSEKNRNASSVDDSSLHSLSLHTPSTRGKR